MGLKTFTIDFAELASKHYLYGSYKYHFLNKQVKKEKYILKSRIFYNFDVFTGYAFKSEYYEKDGVKLLRIGDFNNSGDVCFDSMVFLPEEYFEKYKRYKVKNKDIVIALTGATIGKTCFIDELNKKVLLNQRVGILRAKDEKINCKFYYYLTKLYSFQFQIQIDSMGKGQQNISPSDVSKIKIPLIPKLKQDKIVAQIKPIEKKIKKLKAQITPPQKIINKVFAREFGFDLEKFEKSKKEKFFEVNFSIISKTNNLKFNVSTSLSNKINFQIPNVKYFKIKSIAKSIFAGGDMPKDFSDEKNEIYQYPIFSNGKEKFGFIAYFKKARVKEKAITISARGTIGFAVARNESYFPIVRLISVIPIKKFILNEYLANVINFQNIEKSGNTIAQLTTPMVENIKIPIPDLRKQKKIVNEIKAELNKQEEIKRKIENERNKIDEIIEKAIKES
ncbi:MAG: hypothetical protein B6I26_07210 [Desulfobacteraceae bacterium 4572_130]|nr:MAG: hypothetical protein B6I26_07210 [Desulfobacteraceae bacterium 4572_130]